MDIQLIGRCGAYCGVCEWKTRMNCPGCLEANGNVFWGECDVAKCSIEKGFQHCGFCPEVPCDNLKQRFDMLEHGDNGERLDNLNAWACGKLIYKEITKKK